MEESKWKPLKDLEDNYKNIKTALTQLFKHVIDDAYHTGATGMEQRGFGMFTPKQIMEAMMTLYRKPSLPELEAALRRLLEPMDWTKPTEVMLRNIKGAQILLLSNPEEIQQLSDISLINYTLIKMNNSGLYGKPIERWNERTVHDRQHWSVFSPATVAKYERMLH